MSDENSRLLGGSTIRYDSPSGRSLIARTYNRPPLLSVPSNQSLRSIMSSASGTEFDSYHKHQHNNDTLSILDFDLYKKLNEDGEPHDHQKRKFDLYAYLAYYIPILNWLPKYSPKTALIGDALAGLSLASFQIPLVMSIASSLAHLPPICGLYGMIIGSSIYAIFGSVPILIVGPSPSTAIIYGQVIELIHHESKFSDLSALEISSFLTFSLSGVLLACGICRMGYLDNVLSRALLKGFVAAMGVIMIINQFSTEMGLEELSMKQPHITTVDKLIFAFKNYDKAHKLTTTIAVVILGIVLSIRSLKNALYNKYKWRSAIYFPELLLMVSFGTFLSWCYGWHTEGGVKIVGDIKLPHSSFGLQNPFQWSRINVYKHTFTTSFLCTILGYFDSTTAVKALGAKYNYNVSSNRELVALGIINFIIGLFSGLPSFGALGRSKINILAGATTPMAGIIMSVVSVFTVLYLLQFIYYLPECVLALTTTIVGITVLQEVPADLSFFWSIGGYDEMFTFLMIFSGAILWSAEAGVTLGVLVAVARVIKHSTRSRIQILGRIPNTAVFRDADALIEESFTTFQREDTLENSEEEEEDDDYGDGLRSLPHTRIEHKLSNLIAEIEDIEGVLIIKIPEPLNFANVGDLKNKLARIERYGSLLIHPSQPRTRDYKSIKFIIIDCKGMNAIDSSATQVLYEIIKRYIEEDQIPVCFARMSTNKACRQKLKTSGIAQLINKSYHSYSSRSSRNASSTDLAWSASGLGDGFFLSIDEALKTIGIHNV
ncbi:uncharacterized protein J8A68_001105 [[Candida] subhashii]|uniref:STAS domain-containing protein n=1 Tax=[Candida] subhashii TaxID=561895 RepID=A0A8J5UST3_9ASCO|nr:uncharacterized protein J8A68_001105 [[Candida] subhashii]KAG7665417.1 hypothetical protein J8A68_001105 [[Candida] subhashii]